MRCLPVGWGRIGVFPDGQSVQGSVQGRGVHGGGVVMMWWGGGLSGEGGG